MAIKILPPYRLFFKHWRCKNVLRATKAALKEHTALSYLKVILNTPSQPAMAASMRWPIADQIPTDHRYCGLQRLHGRWLCLCWRERYLKHRITCRSSFDDGLPVRYVHSETDDHSLPYSNDGWEGNTTRLEFGKRGNNFGRAYDVLLLSVCRNSVEKA